MKKLSLYAAVSVFVLVCLAGGLAPAGQKDLVRGKLGIFVKTSDAEYRAKKKNVIVPGTCLRIFLFPENQSFIYVFHNDGEKVDALPSSGAAISRDSLILPASDTFYEIGETEKTAAFILIISSESLPELDSISNGYPLKEWKQLQKKLMEKSRVLDNSGQAGPFSLAGNVRGEADSPNASFIEELPVSSGKKLIIRTYDFKVKK